MMMIPPKSGRRAVRVQNANVISDLGSMYAMLMTSWINEEEERLTRVKGRFASTSTIFLNLSNTLTFDDEKQPPKKGNPYGVGPKFPPIQSHVYVPTWFAEFRKRVIPLANQLRSLHLATENAAWEGSFRGKWPRHEYEKLLDLESEILSALTQLSSALSHLDPSWRISLIRETLVLNPDFVSSVVFSFLSLTKIICSHTRLRK